SVKHLLPGVLGKLPALLQGAYQIRKAKYFIEISLEPGPAQTGPSCFSLRNRFRLRPQMVAAAESKRRRIAIFSRTFSTNSAGMWRELWACRRPVRKSGIGNAGSCRRRNDSWAGRRHVCVRQRSRAAFHGANRAHGRVCRAVPGQGREAISYDTNISVRKRKKSSPAKICKNAAKPNLE